MAENLLSRLRDGILELDAERTTALLDVVDAMREILAAIEGTGTTTMGGTGPNSSTG